MSNKVNSEKEFASSSFNSLSDEIVCGISSKQQKEVTLIGLAVRPFVSLPDHHFTMICTVAPDNSQLRHSTTAIKFTCKLRSIVRKKFTLSPNAFSVAKI
jgi:hypothetical protein